MISVIGPRAARLLSAAAMPASLPIGAVAATWGTRGSSRSSARASVASSSSCRRRPSTASGAGCSRSPSRSVRRSSAATRWACWGPPPRRRPAEPPPTSRRRCYRQAMTDLGPEHFTRPVSEVDPEIAQVLSDEARRQETTLEMIASENFVPQAVMDCQGSTLTNKYAEGLPGKRYYGGCEYVDVAETLAIQRAKDLFGAEHANVQPNAGAPANAAAYMALLDPGDRVLGMRLDHGGHLTHGMKLNFSGKLYDIVAYGVRDSDSRVDMDEVQRIAEETRPKMILGGWSAYPRQLDWARFREIADSVDAYLVVDMAHFAGLVAAGEHPSPVPHADIVTTTTHKTLGGARGGMILCKEEFAKKVNSAVFPGQQGGPLMHVIAGKAVTLKIAATELFRERQRRSRTGAAAIAEELVGAGVNVLTGGTDVHLVLADLR